MRFHEVRLSPRADAPPITSLLDYEGFCGQKPAAAPAAPAPEPFTNIGALESSRRMSDDGWAPYVLDVRSKAEAEIVSLPMVDMQYPHRQVSHIAEQLPRDRDILVHCKAGVRSRAACHTLAGLGFTRLYSMDGGVIAWAKKVDPQLPVY